MERVIGRGRDLSVARGAIELAVLGTSPQRLDRYLLGALAWKSRTRIQGLIHDGSILLNGAAAKPAARVRQGDTILVRLGDGEPAAEGGAASRVEVLHEDPWLLAINKPPGVLVHPVGRNVYNTLINDIHRRYCGQLGPGGDPVRPRLCHRLDKDTTGVLVLGKDEEAHRGVRAQFESRIVAKEYLALAAGAPPEDAMEIAAPLGEGRCLRSCIEHQDLKEARTSVRALERLGPWTLLACRPWTGRLNQIRVHLAFAGIPVAGDARFGGPPPPAGFPSRYLLHSRWIRCFHPRLKSWLEVEAPLPPDFQALIAALRASHGGEAIP